MAQAAVQAAAKAASTFSWVPAITQRQLKGVVVSAGKMDKTVKVRIAHQKWDRKVKKFYPLPYNILASDSNNSTREGDVVTVRSGWRTARHVDHVITAIVSPMGTPLSKRPHLPTEEERLAMRRAHRAAKDVRQAERGRVAAIRRLTEFRRAEANARRKELMKGRTTSPEAREKRLESLQMLEGERARTIEAFMRLWDHWPKEKKAEMENVDWVKWAFAKCEKQRAATEELELASGLDMFSRKNKSQRLHEEAAQAYSMEEAQHLYKVRLALYDARDNEGLRFYSKQTEDAFDEWKADREAMLRKTPEERRAEIQERAKQFAEGSTWERQEIAWDLLRRMDTALLAKPLIKYYYHREKQATMKTIRLEEQLRLLEVDLDNLQTGIAELEARIADAEGASEPAPKQELKQMQSERSELERDRDALTEYFARVERDPGVMSEEGSREALFDELDFKEEWRVAARAALLPEEQQKGYFGLSRDEYLTAKGGEAEVKRVYGQLMREVQPTIQRLRQRVRRVNSVKARPMLKAEKEKKEKGPIGGGSKKVEEVEGMLQREEEMDQLTDRMRREGRIADEGARA